MRARRHGLDLYGTVGGSMITGVSHEIPHGSLYEFRMPQSHQLLGHLHSEIERLGHLPSHHPASHFGQSERRHLRVGGFECRLGKLQKFIHQGGHVTNLFTHVVHIAPDVVISPLL